MTPGKSKRKFIRRICWSEYRLCPPDHQFPQHACELGNTVPPFSPISPPFFVQFLPSLTLSFGSNFALVPLFPFPLFRVITPSYSANFPLFLLFLPSFPSYFSVFSYFSAYLFTPFSLPFIFPFFHFFPCFLPIHTFTKQCYTPPPLGSKHDRHREPNECSGKNFGVQR